MGAGLSQSSTSCILWAAQNGRYNDLVYHLTYAKPQSLGLSSLAPKKRAAIHLAAERGHSSCVQLLVEAGSKINGLSGDGYSPLHLAASNGHYSCVLLLLHLGADVNIRTRFDVTPLHIAASTGHTPCIHALIKCLADINAQESWGQTPLIIATLNARIHCMRALVQLGANTEVKDHHHQKTALHVACTTTRDEETLLTLLDASASVFATDDKGQSSLGVAIENKFYYAVPLLVEYGAKLNQMDRKNMSPLLEEHVDNLSRSPLSLLRLCRVKVRQVIGPASLDEVLPSFGLSESLLEFMTGVRGICEGGARVKRVALQGAMVEHRREQDEQSKKQQKAEEVKKQQRSVEDVKVKQRQNGMGNVVKLSNKHAAVHVV